jgi:hypothetical protein
MGFRFRKSIKVLPGIRLNVGKRGINSVSVGGHGVTTNIGKHGAHTTYSIPGTGISYRTGSHKRGNHGTGSGLGCLALCFLAFIALAAFSTIPHREDSNPKIATAEPPLVAGVQASTTPVARLVEKSTDTEDSVSETTLTSSVRRHRRHRH